jgi:hypothetical protein
MWEKLVGPVAIFLAIPSVLFFWRLYEPLTPGDQLGTVFAGILVALVASAFPVSPILTLFARR